MVKEDPIKIRKKEELRKKADQKTVWQSTGLSTSLNRKKA